MAHVAEEVGMASETGTARVPEYEGWAVCELMGHRRISGYVREVSMYGTAMLRVDVPGDDPTTAFATQYYGGGSIYALTPCTEEIARALSKHTRETPAAIAYALPEPKQCDEQWNYRTFCSPDIAPNDVGTTGGTICGRHKLERDAEEDGDAEAVLETGEPELVDEFVPDERD